MEDLQNKVAQESAARDGLMKMKGVYEANPALGDPMTIEGNLNVLFYVMRNSERFRYFFALPGMFTNFQENSIY